MSTSSALASLVDPLAPAPRLTPLQAALQHERHARRDALKVRARDAAFWSSRSGAASASSGFGRDIVDEEFLQEAKKERVARIRELKAALAARQAIVDAANDAAMLSTALASMPPLSEPVDTPYPPLRELAQARDARATQFLRTDAEIRKLKDERAALRAELDEARATTSQRLAALKETPTEAAAAQNVEGEDGARIRRVQKALDAARGKREMVRGVLRGIILESGLEWASDAVLARAVAETTGESDDEDIDGEALPDEGEDEEEEDE